MLSGTPSFIMEPIVRFKIIINVSWNFNNTVKALLIARALIRIITFHGEGDGRLLEARALTNYI